MKIEKKALALLLALTMVVSILPQLAFAVGNSYPDVPSDHWASDVIAKWSTDDYGVLKGNSDGTFAPSRALSLGELATILSRTFGYTERVSATVTPSWADESVEKAIAAGIVAKADEIDASVAVTREQAVRYIAIAYNVAPVEGNTTFADDTSIGASYKPYVNAFQKLGYVIGKGGGVFDPKSYYTRAEAMTLLDNTTSEITGKSVTGQAYTKALIVRETGVTVTDTTVKGDLIVGQGVGDGDVTLDNVTINGQLLAFGGGSSSITVKGGNAIQSTVANKPYGEAVHLNGAFNAITVTSGTKAIITGTAAKLIILGNSEVAINGANVSMIEINGDNVKTVVNSGGTVDNITIGANKAVINGNGTVKNVNVTANAKFGVEVLTVPTKVTVDVNAGAVKTKNGTIQPGTTATTSNPVSGGLSGGSGGYYTPSVPTAPTEPTTPSTDADLSDEIKDMLGLDKTTDDTDGDGLKDLFEFSYLTTDLLLVDTDGNGISDADEDFDIDGLSNIREEEIGTRPDIPDTDSDGLNDGEEVDNYGTDPLKADTDGDGLTDSEEIKLGLDPNAKKTDGITPDGERRFEQSASDFVKDDGLLNSDNWLVPSVSGNVPGDISRNILLEQSSNDAFDDNHAVLSDVIDVSTSYETIPLTLSFAYSEAYTGDVKSLTIVSFGEDGLKLIDTTVNEDNGALLGEITGNGTFFVIDLDEFLKGLGIDVFANTSANTSPMSFSGISSSLSFETDREDSQTELQPKEESDVKPIEYDYVYDNAGNIVDEKPRDDDATAISTDGADEEIPAQSHSSLSSADLETIETTTPSAIEISSATFDTTTFKAMADGAVGKAEIAFVLDVTGSMDDDIRNVANNIIAFVDALTSNYNVDASFALITYNDYYVPINGKYGTRIHRNNSLNWFASASAFKNEVNRTANEDCGFGGTEVFADGLGMAITELGWGGDASKFVVLLTDESGSLQNRYGYASRDQIADVLLENGICTSVITENSLQSSYRVFWETTGGLYANIKSDFSNVLLELADKVGEVTNAGGEWVFLDDFQAVKLGDALANAATNDTDGDGLTDAQELGARAIVDMLPYISALTNRYSVPVENYTGQTTLTVWKHSSNPVLLDTDYDGISDGYMDYDGTTVTRDPSAKNNSFIGKLYWTEDGQARQSQQDIEFVVDYRMLFKNNGEYKKDLAVLTSLYASVVYDNTYLTVVNADGTSGGSNTATKLERLFGLKDVEDIKINGSDYGVDVDDSTEFVIGHRTVTYKGISRDAIVVVVRGTNGTNAEWSSNFDVGADTSEYYAATGTSHPDWNNKSNHKGFDVAENRILTKINDYLARHSLAGGGSKAILITGHSRGAAIANLLGAHYENASNYVSYTYTFAAPNPTTSSDAGSYKTIFNIVNKDDIIPYLPLSNWGFKKYGVVKEISVQAHYENHWGGAQKGTWEWLTGRDYNNDGGTQRTLDAFAKIANSRSQIYVLDSGSDGTVWENNAGHLTRDGQDKEYNELTETLRNEKLLKYCKISRTTNLLPPYHVEVNYSPAYLMQSLANMTTGVGPLLGHDVKGKYREAKASFVASSGKVVIGGMTHPHLPITYYLIAYNNFVDKV